MLRKILDYEFNIQGRPIDRSGQNNHGFSVATVASIGPEDIRSVGFFAPTSRIDVPYRECWSHLNAVQVEIRVQITSLPQRVNLVEIERSLALFVREDGVVTFTFLAPEEPPDPSDPTGGIDSLTSQPPTSGSSDPFDTLVANPSSPPDNFVWQGVNTDTQFSPDSTVRKVSINQYVTIRAIHDGLTTMRIYIDNELAGVRTDIRYGVPPLISPGRIAIGAWPHDDRYTLSGRIDFLRIWREDPEFPYRQFFCRKMSAEAEACWHKLFSSLAERFENPESEQAVRTLLTCAFEVQQGFVEAIAEAGEEARLELRALSDAYLKLWCGGEIDGSSMQIYFKRFITFLEKHDPEHFTAILSDLLACFRDPKVRQLCNIASKIPDCDPRWTGFIKNIGDMLPNPICQPDPDDECSVPNRRSRPVDNSSDQNKYKPHGGNDADT
jgi:hypothetical protein